jgi:hypothetical protein
MGKLENKKRGIILTNYCSNMHTVAKFHKNMRHVNTLRVQDPARIDTET